MHGIHQREAWRVVPRGAQGGRRTIGPCRRPGSPEHRGDRLIARARAAVAGQAQLEAIEDDGGRAARRCDPLVGERNAHGCEDTQR
jgi:hypothetical protein